MEEEGGHSGMTALGGTWGLTDSIPVGEAAGDRVEHNPCVPVEKESIFS